VITNLTGKDNVSLYVYGEEITFGEKMRKTLK